MDDEQPRSLSAIVELRQRCEDKLKHDEAKVSSYCRQQEGELTVWTLTG
jgi:hypothetical protein